MSLIVVGNISRDTVSYGETKLARFWGGAGLNICLEAARDGAYPKLISIVGTDAVAFLQQLNDYIDTSLISVEPGETCRFQISYSVDGTLQQIQSNFGVARLLDQYVSSVRLLSAHYHICCRNPLDSSLIVKRVAESNYSFSLDFIASSILEQLQKVQKWGGEAAYVFVNYREFEVLQRNIDIRVIRKLVVTAGSEPVTVLSFGKEILQVPCPIVDFVDVTGAGDSFVGSFLASRLKGEELSIAINKAIAAAQDSLQEAGVWRNK